MFADTQRICVLLFAITTALHLGGVNAFTAAQPETQVTPKQSPTQIETIEAQISLAATITATATYAPTTSTLTFSNAPATTIEAAESRTHKNDDDKTETTTTIAQTILPQILDEATKPTRTTSTTEQGKAATNIDGNELKTQIKCTEEDKEAKQELQLMQLSATVNPIEENTSEQETTTMQNIKAEVAKTETLQDTAAVETSTTFFTTDIMMEQEQLKQQQHQHNHESVHNEGQNKNNLYHILLTEVVTDEFGTVPGTSKAEKSQLDALEMKTEDAAGSKVNIADLYPMKKVEFEPIIRDSNTKLLKERTIFEKPEDEAEYRQNLLPNEVETTEYEQRQRVQTIFASDVPKPKPQHLPTLELTLMSQDGDDDDGSVSDFTGKLLAEQDGIITEIEQKFRLREFVPTTSTTTPATKNEHTTVETTKAAVTKAPAVAATKNPINSSINHKPLGGKDYASGVHDFIEPRVKKSFAFPMHRAASDAMSAPYIDFANTRFTGSTASGSPAVKAKTFAADTSANGGNAPHDGDVLVAGAAHPEFSTTKFYNSRELYNEMVMHNKLRQLQSKLPVGNADEPQTQSSASNNYATTMLPVAASRFATLKNVKKLFVSGEPLRVSTPSTTVAPTIKRITLSPTTTAATLTAATLTAQSSSTESATLKPKKFQKELKRAKLLLKAFPPAQTTTTTASADLSTPTTRNVSTITSSMPASTSTLSSPPSSLIVQTATAASSLGTLSSATTPGLHGFTTTTTKTTTASPATIATNADETQPYAVPLTTIPASHSTSSQLAATNPTKSASKPIARPRVLSRLQEKINSLECEIQNVPQDSHLWRGNETHELLLPIVTTKQCDDDKLRQQEQHQTDCSTSTSTKMLSWDGEAEIQSGDILIVEINDAPLSSLRSNTTSAHNTQVYQVTRSGLEHCDVTEGILLDITPLVVDGRKLVTLYDKDLTEGVNLLIVVSELWGSQCVRLKVTTKTDNCGENADCSGKGVCYSNANMEEYECQCCTGFAGPHCEEIDACTPSPCTNNGICVDLSQGHEGNSYQCLCPYGYTGKNCQYESDPCNPAECMNGGTCVGNSTHFRCDCTSGFAGPLCQHSLNECESSPCVHGICVDQEDGFRCFCQPGFAGELCNFEYNECESNPCQNGGECIDHIGSFECRCTKGYSGIRCQMKVDFCANKPCPEGHRCIDHGNDFSCECPGGRNGPDCNQMARTRCNVNPCTHGGTCWSSGDSFYCACRPGFTGTMCEDEFVVETVVSSSEFIVDDTSTRNFNDKSYGSSVVLKSPIELHSAYVAAGVLAAASFIVAVVVTICHCKVNQTYRKFSTRTNSFIPIIGFGRRQKPQGKLNKHWLSGKGLGSTNALRSTNAAISARGHLASNTSGGATALQQHNNVGQLHERPFQRHLAMNLENDMYYTVDFGEVSQHSPLIQ